MKKITIVPQEEDNLNLLTEVSPDIDSMDDILGQLILMNTEIPTLKCKHQWQLKAGLDSQKCYICLWHPSKDKWCKCLYCHKEACITCIEKTYNISLQAKETLNIDKTKYIALTKQIEAVEERLLAIELRIDEIELRNDKGKRPILETEIPYKGNKHHELKIVSLKPTTFVI